MRMQPYATPPMRPKGTISVIKRPFPYPYRDMTLCHPEHVLDAAPGAPAGEWVAYHEGPRLPETTPLTRLRGLAEGLRPLIHLFQFKLGEHRSSTHAYWAQTHFLYVFQRSRHPASPPTARKRLYG